MKEAYEKSDLESRDTDVPNAEFIKRLAAIPLAYEPGTRWEYSVATDVLGLVVEIHSSAPNTGEASARYRRGFLPLAARRLAGWTSACRSREPGHP